MKSTMRQSTSKTQTASVVCQSPFPFERLPYELQLQVLSYTGLVITPSARKKTRFDVLGICIRDKPHPLLQECCGTCNTINFANCLCYKRFKYSLSSTCTCDVLPDCSFRVSRHMHELALYTFYSYNKFYVTGRPEVLLRQLMNLSRQRLRLIRNICVDVYTRWYPPTDLESLYQDPNWDLSSWTSPQNRKCIKILLKFLYKHGHPELSIKITSRLRMILGADKKNISQLRKFCAWLDRHSYERVSVLWRFSKDRGGLDTQSWKTILRTKERQGFGWVRDDGETSRVVQRSVKWFPYGQEWNDVVVGAIWGPKIPLLC
jgi:hypothetical protein